MVGTLSGGIFSLSSEISLTNTVFSNIHSEDEAAIFAFSSSTLTMVDVDF